MSSQFAAFKCVFILFVRDVLGEQVSNFIMEVNRKIDQVAIWVWHDGTLDWGSECGAEWRRFNLSVILDLESREPEVGWIQLVRTTKGPRESPGIWLANLGRWWCHLLKSGAQEEGKVWAGGMMHSALDHWFWDASGTSQQILRTAANQKRKQPAVPRATKCAALCSRQPGRPLKDGLTDW